MAFKERLEASYTRALCLVEGCILCIYKAALNGREALQASIARLAQARLFLDLIWHSLCRFWRHCSSTSVSVRALLFVTGCCGKEHWTPATMKSLGK